MSLVQINNNLSDTKESFFSLGFKPFFLCAAIYSFITILYWLLVYSSKISIPLLNVSLYEWHAHQMIYGFSMAVIAGFLLTAVSNWTNLETLNGTSLKLLTTSWAIPRILLFFGTTFIKLAALFDLIFFIGLTYSLLTPIVKVKQWKQIGILSKLVLLAACNLCFYLDALSLYSNGAYIGVYGGLLLIVSLILTIGGRIMPPFIKNGLNHPVNISNPFWASIVTLILFLAFTLNLLFIKDNNATGVLAGALCALTSYRLICWHTPGIWKVPLLWGLFIAYIFINFGFLLYALHSFISISPFLAIHAFAYGGIGLATLSMMIRVSIGHSGGNVKNPPSYTGILIFILALGTAVRIFLPLVMAEHYLYIIFISQILWIIAFTGLALLTVKIIILPKIKS